ncbi:hypothetical protein HN51_011410 [Arachis hypogaea]
MIKISDAISNIQLNKICFTLQVILDLNIPAKSLNEIKSVLVSALASHGSGDNTSITRQFVILHDEEHRRIIGFQYKTFEQT